MTNPIRIDFALINDILKLKANQIPKGKWVQGFGYNDQKLTGMVVLDRDILSIPAEEIKDIQVEMTIVGGKLVYQRS
jgi:predicted amidohydrolase YtcJ